MSSDAVVLKGRVRPDGSLELGDKVPLAAGDVQVTVRPLSESPQPERFWLMMESIWADLRAQGRTARTKEEIDAEIRALPEDEVEATERLQEELRRQRQ